MSTTAAFYYHWILILTQSFYHMLISLFQFRSNSNRNDHILSSEETKKKNDEYYYSCRSQWDVSNDNDVSCYEVTNEEERNKNQAMREAILHRMDQQQQQQKLGKTQTNCVNGNGDNSMEGESLSSSPRHVAVIMDGNRRYGKAKFGDASKGHVEGSRRLLEFVTWCIEANVQVLTVYAFSTENWNRSPSEVQVLMNLLFHYMDELTIEAKQRGIQIQVISTDTSRIPSYLQEKIQSMVEQTKDNDKFTLNICLSYGSRGEIVNACQSIVSTHLLSSSKEINEKKDVNVLVDEELIQQHLQIKDNPDIIIRTSGEFRLSNFLLWQSAYSEFFFIPKPWPDIRQQDLQQIISTYSHQRQRRYGK